MILSETKIYKNFQTSIPKEIRKKFNVDEDTIVEWLVNEKGETGVKFRKKRKLNDMEGIIKLDYPTNSVELKKELYK